MQIPVSEDIEIAANSMNEAKIEIQNGSQHSDNGANKYENISDNGSEISDEGYRSLGLIQSNANKRISLHSQVSNEDAESNGKKNNCAINSKLIAIKTK